MIKTHRFMTAIFATLVAFVLIGMTHEPVLAQKADKVTKSDKAKAIPPFKNSKPYTKATKGAWKIECFKTTFEASGGKPGRTFENCVIYQDAVSKKDKRLKVRVTLLQQSLKDKKGKIVTNEVIDIATPLGVFLPVGLTTEIDGKAEGRFPYIMCRPNVCLTRMDVNDERKKKLLKGTDMKMLVYLAPGRGFPLNVKLKSLKDAMAIRDKVHAANNAQK